MVKFVLWHVFKQWLRLFNRLFLKLKPKKIKQTQFKVVIQIKYIYTSCKARVQNHQTLKFPHLVPSGPWKVLFVLKSRHWYTLFCPYGTTIHCRIILRLQRYIKNATKKLFSKNCMKWWDFKFYNFEPQANDVIFGNMVYIIKTL